MRGTSFVALYRGKTVGSARLVAVSADPDLVASVAAHFEGRAGRNDEDRVLNEMDGGRRVALRLIHEEAADARN